jgi:hypothetical protein
LLGNKKACLELSCSVIEKTLQSTKSEYNYLSLVNPLSFKNNASTASPLLSPSTVSNIEGIGETYSGRFDGNQMQTVFQSDELVTMDKVFEVKNNFAGLHLSNSPL